ncbi:site-specific integrase [Friedmanniella luteola]|uniref:site-specific integrase n=1 Tax=Friedmanniella luteola TaxID=546871 RepID=UPI0018D32E88|nr:site-specific integrase [Friedmanniella luteola]
MWFDQARESDFSPGTLHLYRDCLDRQILPAMADLRIRELTTGLVDRHLAVVRRKHGSAMAKTTKSVLSNMCRLACRHDALAHNPCRDVARISAKPRKRPTALTVEEVRRLTLWLSQDPRSVARDLPDLVSFLLATGLRIGEALAVRWSDIDLEAGTVDIHGTVLRLRQGGLIIKPSTKSAAGQRILELPSWAIAMLRQRQLAANPSTDADTFVAFPAPVAGGLRDPNNTLQMMRESFRTAGFDGSPATVPQDCGHPDRWCRTVGSSRRRPARAPEDVTAGRRLHGAQEAGHRGGCSPGEALRGPRAELAKLPSSRRVGTRPAAHRQS